MIEINVRKFYRFKMVNNWSVKIAQVYFFVFNKIYEANDMSICLFRIDMISNYNKINCDFL